MSFRQREDKVLLTHIRSEFESSHRSYGRPRMVEELREQGFQVGHHRVGRLMRENGYRLLERGRQGGIFLTHQQWALRRTC